MAEGRTHAGYVMNLKLRERLIVLMVDEGDRMTLKMVGEALGVSRRTVQDYLTREVRAEIEARKVRGEGVTLDDVDKAMMRQACSGNVAAARLVYMRMAQKGEVGPLPSLEDMENELIKLKQLEEGEHGQCNDEGIGDAAAVADGEG